jgi:hypothetical protein
MLEGYTRVCGVSEAVQPLDQWCVSGVNYQGVPTSAPDRLSSSALVLVADVQVHSRDLEPFQL